MRALQIGLAKSGNYWVWRILQALLRRAGESWTASNWTPFGATESRTPTGPMDLD